MLKTIKLWCERHKQKIITWGMVAVVTILAVSVLFRGIHTISSISEEKPQITDGISFNLIPPSDSTVGEEVRSNDKLYKDREAASQAKNTATPQSKDVNISFGEIFDDRKSEPSPATPVETSLPKAQNQISSVYTASVSTHTSTTPAPSRQEEQRRIKAELAKIYGSPEAPGAKNVINNTFVESNQPPRPLSEEELLMQKKKLMESGFNLDRTTQEGIAAAQIGNILITAPVEIAAFIHGTQTVKTGRRVALRLDNNITLSNGVTIPRNTIIYGTLSTQNNRAMISIPTIKYLAFNTPPLIGYSEDGMPGLPIDIEQNQKIIGDATTSAAASTLDKGISVVTRGLVGSVVKDVTNADRTKKESYVTFIDNRKVFLRAAPEK